MTYLDGRELYELFLDSRFWVELSRTKRRQVPKCERCGSDQRLQAHHRFYREHWFDTKLEDLEVLCRPCHQKEHGIEPEKELEDELNDQAEAHLDRVFDPKEEFRILLELRSKKRITRREFLQRRQELGIGPRTRQPKPPKKHRRKKVRGNKPDKWVPTWHYKRRVKTGSNGRPYLSKWTNRGTSSN